MYLLNLGKLHLAPIGLVPHNVLDIGTGKDALLYLTLH